MTRIRIAHPDGRSYKVTRRVFERLYAGWGFYEVDRSTAQTPASIDEPQESQDSESGDGSADDSDDEDDGRILDFPRAFVKRGTPLRLIEAAPSGDDAGKPVEQE